MHGHKMILKILNYITFLKFKIKISENYPEITTFCTIQCNLTLNFAGKITKLNSRKNADYKQNQIYT